MARFLTPEWVDDLAAAARRAVVPEGARLVVQQVVREDDQETAYAVRVADGAVSVVPGRVPDADLTFTQDRDTAAAIARGELSAQAAFLAGRVRVGGDASAARPAARELAAIGDLFASVRAATTW